MAIGAELYEIRVVFTEGVKGIHIQMDSDGIVNPDEEIEVSTVINAIKSAMDEVSG